MASSFTANGQKLRSASIRPAVACSFSSGRRKDGGRRGREITRAVFHPVRAQKQPAFVDRASGHADLLSPEVGHALDRAVSRHDHRAQGRGKGHEKIIASETSLAHHPEPIGYDDVRLAPEKGDVCCGGGGDHAQGKLKPLFGVELSFLDHVKKPMKGAKLDRSDSKAGPVGGSGAAQKGGGGARRRQKKISP